jgi:hypothetical protein
MQAAILPRISKNGIDEERPVTYQITMCGRDGIVMASDRREVLRAQDASVPTINETSKIRISPDGNYAWAYSGGRVSPIFARRILRAVGSGNSEPLIPEILSRSAVEGEASSKFR